MPILRSPIFYMGNKFKLMKHILLMFPNECNTFIDAFGGSGVVSMNYHGKVNTIYNELNPNVVNLIKMVKESDLKELDEYYNKKIAEYNLRTKSNKQHPELNAEGFYKLREEYNQSNNKECKDLFLLLCYSVNHLLRFNQNNEFNASNGADSYNEKNFKQLNDMQNSFKDVIILNKNVFDLDFDKLTENDFVYFDPPYSNTTAVYNEKRAFGGWDIDEDKKLFKLLEKLNERNIKWGLSNVFENRGIKNEHLINWCKDNDWNECHLNINYNPFSRGNSNNDEVFIYNYKMED